MSLSTQKMMHIGLSEQDLQGAKYALLPGDPGRVDKIAGLLDNPQLIGQNREYTSYLGEICGEKVLVMSTGMGGPSTAIGAEELVKLGVKKLIRVGSSGGMAVDVMPGDVVVVQAAIRQEGTSKEYVPVEYPAVADIDITIALRQAAKELGYTVHTGVVHCKDSFYGQRAPETMPTAPELEYKWRAWIAAGALCSEMETAALYTVAAVRRVRAGAVMIVMGNQERERLGLPCTPWTNNEPSIRTAVKAVEILIKQEKSE